MKSPVVLLESLLRDFRRLSPDVKGLDRDLITIKSRHKHEGDGFLTVTLPALCTALESGLRDGRFTCPRNFKQVPRGRIPRFLSGIFCKVFDAITGNLLEDVDSHNVKMLREALLLFKKLQLTTSQEETLDKAARLKFFELEDNLNPILFSERELFILQSVSKYVMPNLDTFQDEDLAFKHGPGAVHEQVRGNQKWSSLVPLLEELDHSPYDFHSWNSHRDDDLSCSGSLRGIAKLITVPKNSTSRRTITVEPLLNQFVQQGYNTLLRNNILKCRILRNSLALTDQTKNQILALEGSRNDKWSTIDLSSASDSISVRILELVFESKPRFLRGILACRSQNILSNGVTRNILKFAGMGNATTFPVQSVLFAILAISAICSNQRVTYGRVVRASKLVRVYGDDIIVPSTAAHLVVDWITKAGLTVNLRKSFLNGPFKESCGMDAFKGDEVTPIYIRYHPINVSKKDPSTLSHYVALSNMAWMRGLYELSITLRKHVEKVLGKTLPLVNSKSSILGLHTRQEVQEYQRWNSKLHRFELRGFAVMPVYRPDLLDGYGALLKYFHLPFQEDKKHLERSPVRFRNRIVQRWVAS